MTTPWTEQITSPATTVEVTCELVVRRYYKNNGAMCDDRKAAAKDVSAWLINEATREQLAEILGHGVPGSEAERDSLKSQLAAAIAERDAAQAEVARMNEIDTTGTNRAKLDDLPGLVAALKKAKRKAERRLGVEGAQLVRFGV